MKIGIFGTLLGAALICTPISAAPPIRVMLLEDVGTFQVDVVTTPVIVANYAAPDERWPDSLKASFEQYIRNGGGLVSVYAADNAFANWKAHNRIIGVGGWRGRSALPEPPISAPGFLTLRINR